LTWLIWHEQNLCSPLPTAITPDLTEVGFDEAVVVIGGHRHFLHQEFDLPFEVFVIIIGNSQFVLPAILVKSFGIVLVEAVAFDGFPHALLAADELTVVFNAQPKGSAQEVFLGSEAAFIHASFDPLFS